MEVRISATKASCQKVDSEFSQASSFNKQVTANTGDSKYRRAQKAPPPPECSPH